MIATGRVRHHKLVLTFKHLRRGSYRLTLLELRGQGQPIRLGHTTFVIS